MNREVLERLIAREIEIDKRLRELERYLPILKETFAGEIGPPFPSMEDLIKAQIRENMEVKNG